MDPSGRTRFWESAERTTRAASGVDGVAIVAKAISSSQPPQALIISQFRPPLGAPTLEIPAGLVDENEDVEDAALRELSEETGFSGRLITMTPICYNDPGITNANMMMAVVEIDLDAEQNQSARQKLDDGEFISVEFAPWDDLLSWLLEKRGNGEFEIDARLLSFALGMQQAQLAAGGNGGAAQGQHVEIREDSTGEGGIRESKIKRPHGALLRKLPTWSERPEVYIIGAVAAAVVSLFSLKK